MKVSFIPSNPLCFIHIGIVLQAADLRHIKAGVNADKYRERKKLK